MSHTTTHKQVITNKRLFLQTCKSRGYKVKETDTVQLYGSNQVKSVASVHIPGWRYEIALTEDGRLQYDHFGSDPGTMEKLGETLQEYNINATLEEVPFDQITNHYQENLEGGQIKLVLEY